MTEPKGPLSAAAVSAIWAYKRTLSPVFHVLGARCRHAPSCADYAAEAFARHGAWRGFWLTFSRVCRCHPFGSHGWDPVPETMPPQGWRFWRHGDWAWTERLAHPVHEPAEGGSRDYSPSD